MTEKTNTPDTPHIATSSNELNKLRAAVLGANDGIISTAGIILGVAGANASKQTILIAGIAGVVAGAVSMAAGEFVSVSSQRDSEKAFLLHNQQNLITGQSSVEQELVEVYVERGFSENTARQAVNELHDKGIAEIELEKELGIDPDDISSPWAAAIASAAAFTVGAMIPLLGAIFSPDDIRVWVTVIAVLFGLVLTGALSARAGKANQTRAALRVVSWGIIAMAATYAIGHLIGITI